MRIENQTKTGVWEESCLCAETLTNNDVHKFYLWSLLKKESAVVFALRSSANALVSNFTANLFSSKFTGTDIR